MKSYKCACFLHTSIHTSVFFSFCLCYVQQRQIREDDNPMLNQGVIGAFAIVRVLSKVQVPDYCTFAPLNCKFPRNSILLSGLKNLAIDRYCTGAMHSDGTNFLHPHSFTVIRTATS